MPSTTSVDNSSDRNYINMLNQDPDVRSGAMSKTQKVYNAVFENHAESSVGFKDLFNLMINQLSNQDFLNPVDDNQYLAQMVQIASMSAMQEMTKWSQSQYMTSLLGKEVTITKYEIGGDITTETGVIDSINWTPSGEYKFMVNGKPYDIKELSNISVPKTKTETQKTEESESTKIAKTIDDDGNTVITKTTKKSDGTVVTEVKTIDEYGDESIVTTTKRPTETTSKETATNDDGSTTTTTVNTKIDGTVVTTTVTEKDKKTLETVVVTLTPDGKETTKTSTLQSDGTVKTSTYTKLADGTIEKPNT